MLRLLMLGWVAGLTAVQLLPALPDTPERWAMVAMVGLFCLLATHAAGRLRRLPPIGIWVAALLLAVAAGGGYSGWRAQERLADRLALEHEDYVTRVVFQVTGLANRNATGQQFEARILQSPVAGIPSRVLVRWFGAGQALVRPGAVYRGALLMRRPHGSLNPHGFDFEAWMFERELRAGATVRGSPVLLVDRPWDGFGIAVQRMRHGLRAAMQPALEGTRYGAVIQALAMGDQAGVDQTDWRLFNRVGITHLVSISGLHVTMLAALAGMAALWGWKRLCWRGQRLAESLPAQVVAAACALAVAWLYCLIAGWGVPAQRTFFMLAAVGVTAILRIPATPSGILVVALVLVTALDPWAPLSPGFWLSFGAVGVLMLMGSGRWQAPAGPRWRQGLLEASRLQLAITVALVPALALQFNEVSVGSPLANAVAIPVVSFLVTPLSLAGMLLAPLPAVGALGNLLIRAAEWVFGIMMWPVAWVGEASWSSLAVAAPSWPWVVLACAGVGWALLPAGPPARWLGWVFILPVLCHTPGRPAVGEWRLTVLDVGQGGAAIIETTHHVVVFDTGPPYGTQADAGSRVVWPYLRARGVGQIDDLIISHADADHAGGLPGVLEAMPVRRVRSSYALSDALAARVGQYAPCRRRQGWMLDGVSFTFLHPDADPRAESGEIKRETNAHSCVLRIQGLHHAALLTGDLDQAQEKKLATHQSGHLRAEVVLMGHHGSRTSSHPLFVELTAAGHAVAQAGHLSRYGHPNAEVIERWRESGARIHRSDWHGAVVFTSSGEGLQVGRERDIRRRYWHDIREAEPAGG